MCVHQSQRFLVLLVRSVDSVKVVHLSERFRTRDDRGKVRRSGVLRLRLNKVVEVVPYLSSVSMFIYLESEL